jgi:hypothetical protein
MKDNLDGFQKLVSTRWTFSILTVETPNLTRHTRCLIREQVTLAIKLMSEATKKNNLHFHQLNFYSITVFVRSEKISTLSRLKLVEFNMAIKIRVFVCRVRNSPPVRQVRLEGGYF